jgi:hypothetical protein
MANGLLGKSITPTNSNITVYTVPPTVAYATASVSCCNTSVNDAEVSIALSTSSNPDVRDYVEWKAVVPGNGGVLERTCLVASPGESFIVNSSQAGVAVRVYGMEEPL